MAELLHRNSRLANVNLTDNRISCTEFEQYGLGLMKLLSSNNTVTVSYVETTARYNVEGGFSAALFCFSRGGGLLKHVCRSARIINMRSAFVPDCRSQGRDI